MLGPSVVKAEHIQAAIRMKFGQEVDTRVKREKDIERVKMRAMELMKIDEKTNPNR